MAGIGPFTLIPSRRIILGKEILSSKKIYLHVYYIALPCIAVLENMHNPNYYYHELDLGHPAREGKCQLLVDQVKYLDKFKKKNGWHTNLSNHCCTM